MKNKTTKLLNEDGVTLIEVLVVIVILAIISAITVPLVLDYIDKSKENVDIVNIETLNSATNYCALAERKELTDVFLGLNSDSEKIDFLYTNSYISEIIYPEQDDTYFLWDESDTLWEIYKGDLCFYELEEALENSKITSLEFNSKDENYSEFNYSVYLEDSWNGFIEKLLEKGEGDSSRLHLGDNGYGENTIGYVNPVNNNQSIVNYNSLDWEGIGNHIPPAILITSNVGDFSYDNISSYKAPNKVKGTMIFCKSDETTNEDIEIFYVKDDGTLSDLINIGEVLP